MIYGKRRKAEISPAFSKAGEIFCALCSVQCALCAGRSVSRARA